ncbi:MAG: type II secretion system protein [Candidatus Saganbacteria bacterium]|nr:type II secretion system protein [Candidatus Saganbacteria bacterium]
MDTTKNKTLNPKSEIRNHGFTLIEMVLSILLISIIVPAAAVSFANVSNSVIRYQRISQAIIIAKEEMAIVNRLPFSNPTLINGYNVTTQNYQGSGFNVTRKVTNIYGNDTNAEVLKKIQVTAQDTVTKNLSFALYTMRAKNVYFGPASQSTPPSGQAVYLNPTEGSAALTQNWLSLFSLENQSPSLPITIDKIKVTWSPIPSGQKLNAIILKGLYFATNTQSGTLVDITNVTFQPGEISTYNQLGFGTQSPQKPFTIGTIVNFTILFQLGDGSQKSLKLTRTVQ